MGFFKFSWSIEPESSDISSTSLICPETFVLLVVLWSNKEWSVAVQCYFASWMCTRLAKKHLTHFLNVTIGKYIFFLNDSLSSVVQQVSRKLGFRNLVDIALMCEEDCLRFLRIELESSLLSFTWPISVENELGILGY